MLGSANISGSKAMHIMTGNLSHQIEHHLFPDLPSNRYAEIAPRIRDLFDRYGLNYHTAPLPQQVGSAWHKIIRLSLPNGWLELTNRRNLLPQLAVLYKMTTGSPKVRRTLQRGCGVERRGTGRLVGRVRGGNAPNVVAGTASSPAPPLLAAVTVGTGPTRLDHVDPGSIADQMKRPSTNRLLPPSNTCIGYGVRPSAYRGPDRG